MHHPETGLVACVTRALEKAERVRVEFLADLIYRAKGHERILELVGRLFLDLAAATVDAIHRPAADILFHIRRRRVRNRALERAFRNLAWALWQTGRASCRASGCQYV